MHARFRVTTFFLPHPCCTPRWDMPSDERMLPAPPRTSSTRSSQTSSKTVKPTTRPDDTILFSSPDTLPDELGPPSDTHPSSYFDFTPRSAIDLARTDDHPPAARQALFLSIDGEFSFWLALFFILFWGGFSLGLGLCFSFCGTISLRL